MNISVKKNKAWQVFVNRCHTFKSPSELEHFFEVILTISEREELPKRVAIICELLKGQKTQREIAKQLGVSIANITRASNVIKASTLNLTTLFGVDHAD